MSLLLKKHTKIIVVCAITLILLILAINPYNLIRPKILASDVITPEVLTKMKGKYSGKGGLLGVNVLANVNINGDDTITINSLSCTGDCPQGSLIKKCGDNNKVKISTKKSQLGYKITGKCVENVKVAIGTTTKIEGFYLVKNINKLYMQISLNIDGLTPLINVPLNIVKL